MSNTQTVVDITPLQISKQLAHELSSEAENRGMLIEDFLRAFGFP